MSKSGLRPRLTVESAFIMVIIWPRFKLEAKRAWGEDWTAIGCFSTMKSSSSSEDSPEDKWVLEKYSEAGRRSVEDSAPVVGDVLKSGPDKAPVGLEEDEAALAWAWRSCSRRSLDSWCLHFIRRFWNQTFTWNRSIGWWATFREKRLNFVVESLEFVIGVLNLVKFRSRALKIIDSTIGRLIEAHLFPLIGLSSNVWYRIAKN